MAEEKQAPNEMPKDAENMEYSENIENTDNTDNTDNAEKDQSLEDLFTELDDIVSAMDDPQITLEDSFALYEKGMKKVRQCNDRLDMVEKKMLVIAQDGTEVPFDE